MDNEITIKDFEILRVLYHGNHLNKEDLERGFYVVTSLNQAHKQRWTKKCTFCNKSFYSRNQDREICFKCTGDCIQ